jgi:uncharacterized protein (DUF58 family)
MPLKEFKANLIPGVKELNVFVRKNLLAASMSGEIGSSLKGRGIEFEEYRSYGKGEDSARIDWRASKKSRKLLIREYKLDININAFFMIDVSESMLFASTPMLKCEYAAQVASTLFYGILEAGNSVGFCLFNDTLHMVNKPLMGRRQFYIFSKEISNPKNYGGGKDLRKVLQQALSILDRKCLIFIVSDFINADDRWIDVFKIIARKHEVIGVMVRDPRDIAIPKNLGQINIEDPLTGERMHIDAHKCYKEYEDFNQGQMKLFDTVFINNRASLLQLRTDESYLQPTLQFLKRRGGRWK